MKLFAWRPHGHGPLSWFVMAATFEEAESCVLEEIKRLKSLPDWDYNRITDYECDGWGTDSYEITVAERGVVLYNAND